MQALTATFASDADCWNAVQQRTSTADGAFFYSVATTGVYCRPSCASRPARRENVAFHRTREEAERAGFRPCLRCRPDLPPRDERHAALIADACRFIQEAEATPSLAELAARAALSPHHFHRIFSRIAGVTPKAYAAAHRQAKVTRQLQSSASVTDAIYDAGFSSSSRFYENSVAKLGMKPSAYRKGGEGESIWHAIRKCSLGHVLVAGTARGVCAILLGDDPAALAADLRNRFPRASLTPPEAAAGGESESCQFHRWIERAVRLIDDPLRCSARALPLDIRGTAFQRQVWEALQAIRPGVTSSYREIAVSIGKPAATRAVANACAANNVAVAIPCHRVIASDGKPGGYRWGAGRKEQLLKRERPVESR